MEANGKEKRNEKNIRIGHQEVVAKPGCIFHIIKKFRLNCMRFKSNFDGSKKAKAASLDKLE